MTDLRKLLLSPAGRLGRQDFLIAGLGLIVVGAIGKAIPLVGVAVTLALLWPWTCIAAKRLHDMDRSALWATVLVVPTAFVAILAMAVEAAPMAFAGTALALAALTASVGMIALLAALGFLVWLVATPGSVEANRYGVPACPLLSA